MLLEHGASPALPAGIIAQGTTPDQRVVTASLATIASASAAANLESPALLVVGDVVALHSTLAWFGATAGVDLSRTA
jgi:siroheme synthase